MRTEFKTSTNGRSETENMILSSSSALGIMKRFVRHLQRPPLLIPVECYNTAPLKRLESATFVAPEPSFTFAALTTPLRSRYSTCSANLISKSVNWRFTSFPIHVATHFLLCPLKLDRDGSLILCTLRSDVLRRLSISRRILWMRRKRRMGKDRIISCRCVGVVLALLPATAWAASDGNETDVSICEATHSSLAGGEDGGLILPLFSSEPDWPVQLRALLYFLGLIWTFLGVGIVSDTFMMAIEVITAKQTTVKMPDGAIVSVKVWNATVANLSLMALGSSAPEILLSVIEIISASFFSGELGPSTIVGSAAFNLFMIIAVCVLALPDGEVKKVEDMGVYIVTAAFSLFAYFWLLIILMGTSPNVVEAWEGIMTFAFFPVLIFLAYGADQHWFSSSIVAPNEHVLRVEVDGHAALRAADCAELIKHAIPNVKGDSISDDQRADLVAQIASENSTMSRAQLRMDAIRQITGGRRMMYPKSPASRRSQVNEPQKAVEVVALEGTKQQVYFSIVEYAVIESEGIVTLQISRSADQGTVTAHYETSNGTATAGKDYVEVKDMVVFNPGEMHKTISVQIIDDDEVEEDEKFFVTITSVEADGAIDCTVAHDPEKATVTIIDDDEPGAIGFQPEHTFITCTENDGFAEITVSRLNGSKGTISCSVDFEDLTAVSEKDYVPLEEGERKLTFESTQITKRLRVQILDERSYEKKVRFKVVLRDPEGTRAALSKYTECIVEINADDKMKELVDSVVLLANKKLSKYKVGTSTWLEQFKQALVVGGDDDDPDYEPGNVDYVMHFISLPWKVLFALIPPTDFYGGWVTFFTSLLFIGVVTAVIGDLASIFGCMIGLRDPVTAITLVALGTSLPDTFASKAAALADSNADASIGNVTGSNSVNVFLGLGLPWTIASLYWTLNGANAEWDERFPEKDYRDLRKNYRGKFVVEAGSLGISVAVFAVCACICLATLYFRRVTYGGELGGPRRPARLTAALFTGLWFVYLLVSALVEYSKPE